VANAFQGKTLTGPRTKAQIPDPVFMGVSTGSTLGGSEDQIYSLKCKLYKVKDLFPLFYSLMYGEHLAEFLLGLNKYVWNE